MEREERRYYKEIGEVFSVRELEGLDRPVAAIDATFRLTNAYK